MSAANRGKGQEHAGGIADRLFLEHPRSLGMSWSGHASGAFKVGFQLIGAGLAAIIHGVIPGILGETASSTVARVHEHIQKTRGKPGDGA